MESKVIQREGVTTGRKANYLLIVDGVKLGRVKRQSVSGGGILCPRTRLSVWTIQGLQAGTQEEAEAALIQRGGLTT